MFQNKNITKFLSEKPHWLIRNGISLLLVIFLMMIVSSLFIREERVLQTRLTFFSPIESTGINAPAEVWFVKQLPPDAGSLVHPGDTILTLIKGISFKDLESAVGSSQKNQSNLQSNSIMIPLTIRDSVYLSDKKGYVVVNKTLVSGKEIETGDLRVKVLSPDSLGVLVKNDLFDESELPPDKRVSFKFANTQIISAKYIGIQKHSSGKHSYLFIIDKFEPFMLQEQNVEMSLGSTPLFYSIFNLKNLSN